MRWDHYQLLVNQNAVSPRISVARYFPSAGLVLHASYDRIFQTPDSGNILLSSSAQVVSLNPEVFRLPVEPSHGNYFEIGGTKSIFEQLRFDANYYRRYVNNYADDDQILSTAVSFPIAFDKAIIYGAEAKLEIPKWGRWSGYASYSYMVGNAWLPGDRRPVPRATMPTMPSTTSTVISRIRRTSATPFAFACATKFTLACG